MPRKSPAPLPDVVATGDHRSALEAVRDHVARTLLEADPPNVAALAKQLQAVLRELAELPPAKQESNPVDDLTAKRASRRAAASGAGGAAAGDVRRRRGGGAG